MNQSFVVPDPMGPGKTGAFRLCLQSSAKGPVLRVKFMVKSVLKARPPGDDKNEEQQVNWTVYTLSYLWQ